MKIRTGLVEEQQKPQQANENTVSVKRRLTELDRQALGQVLGDIDDTVDLSTSQQLNQIGERHTARVAELKKLYAAGELRYDSKKVAELFVKQVDEEISFDKLLRKPDEQG